MKTVIASLFLFAGLAVSARGQAASPHASQPDPSVVKASEAYLQAVLAGDAAAVAALYRDDAVEMPPCRQAIRGRAAIEQYYRELLEGPWKVTSFTFQHLEARVVGDMAYSAGTYERKLSKGSAEAVEDTGKYFALLKRTAGAWKTAYVIYNSDRPAETPCAATLGPSFVPPKPAAWLFR